jgi:choline dehydrogenase-like flavoprotein
MAARQLIDQGIPVTMLESGTDKPDGLLVRAGGRTLYRKTPRLDDEGDCVMSGNPSTVWHRSLRPGGLSNQWTGAVPRFAPLDFSDGERLDLRYRWPLDYRDLEPFYQQAEKVLQITAAGKDSPQLPVGYVRHSRLLPKDWQEVADVAAGRGQGLTTMPLAEGPNYLLARRATAFNSYSRIVQKLMSRPLFRLRSGCTALRLEWSGSTSRVTSVIYHDEATGSQQRLPAAAVVVACGALGSAKLLFDSACSDFPDGLGNDAGLLGRYLHDHPKEWWSIKLDRPITRLARAAYLTRRPFDQAPPLMSTSWTLGLGSGSEKEKVRSLFPGKTTSIGVQVFGSMIPSERFYVRPHPTLTDRFGLPQLEIHLDFDSNVIQNVHSARASFMELMAEAGYDSTLDPVVPQCTPGLAVHYGGTVRMHRSREFGVTDPWNRLFDVPNVAVVDAGTFTTSSEKNPTLTAMALAARAAQRLAGDLRRGL